MISSVLAHVDAVAVWRQRILSEVMDAVTRAKALTGQLLTFSRKNTLAPNRIDINASIRDASRRIQRRRTLDLGFRLLARFKIPREFRAVSEFPKTASGKVRKYRLLDNGLNSQTS